MNIIKNMLSLSHNTDLELLIEKEDWHGVKNFFEQLLNEPLSKEEKGWLYLNLAMIYIRLNSSVNKNYDTLLSGILESLKKVSSAENELAKQATYSEILESL